MAQVVVDAQQAAVEPRLAAPAAPSAWDTSAVEALRAAEYGRLDAQDQAYLDYTGGGLYAESQLREHQDLLRAGVFGNPHSTSPTSRAATELAEGARQAILEHLNASPDDYTVIFTANASAALKLVGESFPFTPTSRYLLTTDNHNSVSGIREFARSKGAEVTYLPLQLPSLRLDDAAVRTALDRAPDGRSLFAYPAQSNYSGVRHPLEWINYAQERGWNVLLDAAAFLPANGLDLSRWHPDFVTISWYKLFGYPTGIGSLVARRDALARLERPWYAGGSIGVASVIVQQHTLGPAEVGFEDGTVDYLGLPGIEIGLRHISNVGIDTIHRRVQHLTRTLLDRMQVLRRSNGAPRVRLFGPTDDGGRGGTISFNVLDPAGGVVDFWKVEALAAERRISLRTGCFCNAGASETARGITADEMNATFALGRQPSYDDLKRLLPGKALGAVRISVGIATNERDVSRLVEFLEELAG